MLERFLNWLHEEKIGDLQVVLGGELIAVATVLFCVFLKSTKSVFLKIEHPSIFLCVIAGFSSLLIIGVILLTYGIVLKVKNKK